MKKVLKKFGKYLLLDRLAQGGMAEIFRAWAPSVDGGGRLIVLKCVQPSYGQDPEFIQMFRSEIRVTMGLNHPNIVQLYDFGESDNQPFIAMELVDGKNLKQFTTRVQQKNQLLAPEYAAHIISQVAAGLHYAHCFRDRTTGVPLNIIHRDVSPQNLLIAYEGNVKIIDFGIAKASSNRQATRAGIIKGKPSYLSPEQIEGLELDGRSDIFSLGAVLWETLTGRKLFSGNTDLEAIRMIEDCDKTVKAPSKLNPAVPPELDAIVFKALAKDREKRFKTAEEMQRALHRFIYQFKPDFDPSEFAKYFQALFQVEIDEEQKTIRQLNVEAKDLFIQVEAAQGAQNKTKTKEGDGTKMGKEIGRAFTALNLESVPVDLQTMPKFKTPGKTVEFPRVAEERFRTPRKVYSDFDLGRLVLPILVAGAAILFLLPAIRDHNKQSHAVQEKPASVLQLDIAPTGGTTRFFVDAQPVNPAQVRVAPGTTVKLIVMKDGFKPLEQDLTAAADASPISVHATLDPLSYGSLTLFATPTADVRIISGELSWNQKTPVDHLKLPPGQYQVLLSNANLGMQKQLVVQIQADKALTQEINLDLVK